MSDSSDPMDCSLPGSSVHGIFQARVLEWGAIAFSKKRAAHTLFSESTWWLNGKWTRPLWLWPFPDTVTFLLGAVMIQLMGHRFWNPTVTPPEAICWLCDPEKLTQSLWSCPSINRVNDRVYPHWNVSCMKAGVCVCFTYWCTLSPRRVPGT